MTADDLIARAEERRRVGWEIGDAMTPTEMVNLARQLKTLRDAMMQAADIIDRNLHHQREKVEDASAILRQALAKS